MPTHASISPRTASATIGTASPRGCTPAYESMIASAQRGIYIRRMNGKPNATIAVVDDDESVREATSGLLRSSGFRVQTFESAETFLQSAPVLGAYCLVLDMAMPGMSGLDLLRHLVAVGRRVPTIFITAHDSPAIRREAMLAGAIDMLPKPFSDAALIEAIRLALSLDRFESGGAT